MPARLVRLLVVAVAFTVAFVLAAAAVASTAEAQEAGCDDYSCADYRGHDLDNYHRARGRQIGESTSPAYHQAFAPACADTQSRAAAKQVADLPQGRVYGGVGQATCWWSVGDAPAYFDVEPRRIHFLSRTGAKLQGHIWGADGKRDRPGVVITTGSIQASDQMYWWAARALAAAGYVVMTFDVQGQGQSETFGHAPGDVFPTADGVPSQQAANFHDGPSTRCGSSSRRRALRTAPPAGRPRTPRRRSRTASPGSTPGMPRSTGSGSGSPATRSAPARSAPSSSAATRGRCGVNWSSAPAGRSRSRPWSRGTR